MASNPRYEIVFVGLIGEEDPETLETYEVAWSLEDAKEIGEFVKSLVGIDRDRLLQMTVPDVLHEQDMIVNALDFVEQHVFEGHITEYVGIFELTRKEIKF